MGEEAFFGTLKRGGWREQSVPRPAAQPGSTTSVTATFSIRLHRRLCVGCAVFECCRVGVVGKALSKFLQREAVCAPRQKASSHIPNLPNSTHMPKH